MLDGISDTVSGGLIAITSSVVTLVGAIWVDNLRSKRDQKIKRYELLYSPCASKLEVISGLFVKMEILYDERSGYDPKTSPENAESAKLYNDYGLVYNNFELQCKDLIGIISKNIHLSMYRDWKHFTSVRQTMDRIIIETTLDQEKKFHISSVVEGKEILNQLKRMKVISKRISN